MHAKKHLASRASPTRPFPYVHYKKAHIWKVLPHFASPAISGFPSRERKICALDGKGKGRGPFPLGLFLLFLLQVAPILLLPPTPGRDTAVRKERDSPNCPPFLKSGMMGKSTKWRIPNLGAAAAAARPTWKWETAHKSAQGRSGKERKSDV